MSKPAFWRVGPNPDCITCFDETNTATGLVAEKGGGYICCPDCGKGSCYGCLYSSEPTARGVDIWCAKHGGLWKSPYEVCGMYKRR